MRRNIFTNKHIKPTTSIHEKDFSGLLSSSPASGFVSVGNDALRHTGQAATVGVNFKKQ